MNKTTQELIKKLRGLRRISNSGCCGAGPEDYHSCCGPYESENGEYIEWWDFDDILKEYEGKK